MKIIGTGIDIVEIFRIRELLRTPDKHFETSCFTKAELAELNEGNRAQFIAERFAAKESVLKALGTGWTRWIAWTDVEIVKRDSVAPSVLLSGKCAEIAASLGITNWTLGVSRCKSYAIASTVAWQRDLPFPKQVTLFRQT